MDKVNFGDELVTPDEKTRRVGGGFTSVARSYDLMNDLMSGGMHRLWKNRFVAKVNPRQGEHILDMNRSIRCVSLPIDLQESRASRLRRQRRRPAQGSP